MTIWATDVWFMNDAREATFGLDVIDEFLVSKTQDNASDRVFAEETLDLLHQLRTDNNSLPDSYIACFSTKSDQLSQWRAYGGGGGGGFAIGFDSAKLTDLSLERPVDYNHSIAHVIYDRIEQFKVLNSLLEPGHLEAETGVIEMDFLISAVSAAAIFKHHGFHEESEVRLHLFRRRDVENERPLQFRISAMGLTPYLDVDLRSAKGATPIREIVIGPTVYPAQARRSVEYMLATHGYSDVEVRLSEIALQL